MSRSCSFYILVFCSTVALAQDTEGNGSGFTFYERLSGTASRLGSVTRLDSTVGYNFNRYFGVDAGIPLYFVRPSDTTRALVGSRPGNGIGDFYGDVRFTFANPIVNYFSVLTITAPTGETARGFSTGKSTVDWTNHFEHAFGRLTPYANLGLANTVSDTMFFVRPFATHGFVAHVEGGAMYRLHRYFYAGGSGYAVLPSGTQTVDGRLVSDTITTRDHGVILRGQVPVSPYFQLDAGYTRSAVYDLNAVFFGVGFNVAAAIRKGM
jgi:hypothetical protein